MVPWVGKGLRAGGLKELGEEEQLPRPSAAPSKGFVRELRLGKRLSGVDPMAARSALFSSAELPGSGGENAEAAARRSA